MNGTINPATAVENDENITVQQDESLVDYVNRVMGTAGLEGASRPYDGNDLVENVENVDCGECCSEAPMPEGGCYEIEEKACMPIEPNDGPRELPVGVEIASINKEAAVEVAVINKETSVEVAKINSGNKVRDCDEDEHSWEKRNKDSILTLKAIQFEINGVPVTIDEHDIQEYSLKNNFWTFQDLEDNSQIMKLLFNKYFTNSVC